MAKTKSKKKQDTKADTLLNKVLAVCGAITAIAKATEGVQWIYDNAWPLIEPLLPAGLFSPEYFWWDSFVQPVRAGKSPAKIVLHLEKTLGELRADREHIERRLAGYSESDRQRISDTYDKILSEIHIKYPNLLPPSVA
jgi:hypothetical protein